MSSGPGGSASSPRVSVVFGIYKPDRYLSEALRSLFAQTFQDFEIILVLDARSRAEAKQILELCEGAPHVRVIESPPLGGLALALNLGIGAARGEYIARMDGDDISLPGRFEQQIAYLDAHPDTAVVGCRLQMIDADGKKLSRPYPFYETDSQIRRILPFRTPMPHPAVMMRKDALLAVGGYKYAHSGEDWELFMRIARDPSRKLHNLDSTLFLYRRHAGQGTRPELITAVFRETAGFLLVEFLHTFSWRYLAGVLMKHPWLLRTRNAVRRRAGDTSN